MWKETRKQERERKRKRESLLGEFAVSEDDTILPRFIFIPSNHIRFVFFSRTTRFEFWLWKRRRWMP
jgi:hypothetical protein